MNQRTSRLATIWLVVVVSALTASSNAQAGPGAHGPGGEHLDAPTGGASPSGLSRWPDGSVSVPKSAQRRMGIRTLLAPESEAVTTVELSGRVIVDPNASGQVQATHGGRIEPGPRGLPVSGQAVRRGEVLAFVRHHAEPYALAAQRSQLVELRADRALAEQRLQRLQGLEGSVPRKDIEAASSGLGSLRDRERSIAASLGAREALVAPIAGVVARANALAGQVVETKDVLFEVIDPARVLIEATTADPGLSARIAGAQLQDIAGANLKLIGAARVLRDGVLPLTFSVRAEKPGSALPLAIGQPITLVAALKERTKGFVLPAQAVVRSSANETIVWIKSGAERFVPQPVQVRALDAKTVVVTRGLGADNRVVVEGAALIAQIR